MPRPDVSSELLVGLESALLPQALILKEFARQLLWSEGPASGIRSNNLLVPLA